MREEREGKRGSTLECVPAIALRRDQWWTHIVLSEQFKIWRKKKKKKLAICCVSLGLLLLVILLPLSYQYVDFTEYGLRYNTITKKVEPTEAFEAHRFFGGLSTAYHIYPKTVQIVIFNGTGLKKPIEMKDKIGGSFNIEVNMGYQLLKDSIYDIFRTYKARYEESYLSNIRAAVRQKAQGTLCWISSKMERGDIWKKRSVKLLPLY